MTKSRGILSVLGLLALGVVPAAADDALPADAAWVKANAHPLETVEAGNGFDDLAFLEKAIGGARVVGLGEATHGTREHFQMKHRLLEFLATKMGFNVFAIEASMPESYRVDRYVSGGTGDPAALVGGMYFWTWNTEEVLDMVKWMRAFNEREAAAKSGKHVRFAGFDMQMPDYAQKIVRRFVERHDAEFLSELDARWAKVSAAKPSNDAAFGCASVVLPNDKVRGKHVHFEGFIRSEDVADGWAGLWARVNVGRKMPFFDNMSDRGPKGTRPWKRYSIDFDVPSDATGVQVGTVFDGSGRAWFDCLQLTIDGVVCGPDAFADPSFESKELGPFVRGFALERFDPAMGQYTVTAERADALDGERCLVMRGAESTKKAEAVTHASAAAEANVVMRHMEAQRRRYVDGGASPADAAWAIQNARVVLQAMQMRAADAAGGAARDASMAENVRWILDQDPNAKVVVWAHNLHVSRVQRWMGAHLAKALGPAYVNIGFLAGSGTYYAMGEESKDAPAPHVHPLQEPVEGSAELTFRRAGMPLAILDLRSADAKAPGGAWTSGCKVGDIGAMRQDARFDNDFNVREAYDLLVYVDRTTAAHQLKTPPAAKAPED